MGYYDNKDNVEQYIEMSKHNNNNYIVNTVKEYLPNGSTILEIGMGPGKDMDSLRESFHVTGTDSSAVFINRYWSKHKDADLMVLDAVSLNTSRRFDCVYSNKVLQHLTRNELNKSIKRQRQVLHQGGILFHTFWYGEGEEEFDGLLFTYYDENELKSKFGKHFNIVDIKRYQEEQKDDSILIVCRKTFS